MNKTVIAIVTGVLSGGMLFLALLIVVVVLTPSSTPAPPRVDALGTPLRTPTTLPTPTATPTSWAPPFKQLCERDKTLTDAQFVEYLETFRGKKVIDWTGWVYDVHDRSRGYAVLIAMDPPGFLWARDIELLGLPKDQALCSQVQLVMWVLFSVKPAIPQRLRRRPCSRYRENPWTVSNAGQRRRIAW